MPIAASGDPPSLQALRVVSVAIRKTAWPPTAGQRCNSEGMTETPPDWAVSV